MTANELRSKFLKFFESKGHTIIPSAPVVPQNDPTVLFTTAGMHPLVPYLLGEKHPGGNRVANSQKVVRTTDIDDVGDNRHLTFFEMLGNWSFGDYFKAESIPWSFEFLTSEKGLSLDPEHIYVSIFAGDSDVPKDEEAIELWKKAFRSHPTKMIEAEFSEDIYNFGGTNKIFPYGRDKNWWQAGDKGPSGPDTEIFADIEGPLLPEMRKRHKLWQSQTGSTEDCHINCDCGRFIEIWNNVFMQYNGLGDGKYEPLAQKNVDTGMGLERVLVFLNGQNSVYDTDLFKGAFDIILNDVPEMTGEQPIKASIISDHIRAAVFMVGDGVEPSNKERGYILRRILRRAMVHAKMLSLKAGWLEKLIDNFINLYSEQYPELVQDREKIVQTIKAEYDKFNKTLESGLKELYKLDNITGTDAFNLFQTYGIPWEITRELALQRGMQVDKSEFEQEFKKHQDLSRTASAGTYKGGLADTSERTVRLHTATHLLQAALRKFLGQGISQKGSNVNTERTRFDFPYPEKVSEDILKQVEEYVNEMVSKKLTVRQDFMTQSEARELGALGVFGEKYGDTVSIYTIVDEAGNVYSREFCGGPHVKNTSEVGKLKILKEEAVSAGVRRIKATVED
jgi:alanyl-tRNA synthetase